MKKKLLGIICFILLFVNFLSSANPINANEEDTILFITSYSPESTFLNSQLRGLRKSLSEELGNKYKLHVEFVNTIEDKPDFKSFIEIIKLKESLYKDLDAIILGDDLSLEFCLDTKDNFNSNIPKFFMNVHDEKLIKRAKQKDFVGGIYEFPSIEENIKFINSITKERKNLILMLYTDDIYTESLNEFYSFSDKYKNLNFNHIFIPSELGQDFISSVSNINPNDSLVLFLPPYDNSSPYFENQISIGDSVSNLIKAPIFTLGTNSGFTQTVGGMVIDDYTQSAKVGELIASTLKDNKKPEYINSTCVNTWVFNYNKLRSLGIHKSDLPDGSTILDEPIPLRKQSLDTLFPVFIVITFLLLIIGGLIVHLFKKRNYNKELYKAKQHAEEMNIAKNNFISTISHELRTPVAIIMSSSQLLQRLVTSNTYTNSDSDLDKINNNFDIISQNSNRLLRLVNNIIDVAKIDSAVIDLNLQNTNIVSLIEDTVTSIIPYAQMKNLDVVFDTTIEEIIMPIDIEKIERVFLNLLSNAIKFSNIGGCIDINISSNDFYIVILVKDTGVGIDKSDLPNIFEKFTQIDNGFTRKNEGSGIGLSIVKSFIELHNGNIFVESTKGVGTTFKILLPLKALEELDPLEFIPTNDVYTTIPKSSLNTINTSVNIELSDIYIDRTTKKGEA